MKKLAFRSILISLVLLAATFLGLVLWMESAHFAGIVGDSLKAQASLYNLCLYYKRLRIHPLSLQAEIDDLSVEICGEEPLAHVDKVYASLKLLDLFTGSFALDELIATRPVLKLKFRADGSSNLARLRLPEANNSNFSAGGITIDRGELIWDGVSYNFSGKLSGLNIVIQSLQGEAKVKLAATDCRLDYAAKVFELGRMEGQATVYSSHATVEQLLIESPYATTTLSGRLTNFRALSYKLNLYSRIDLKAAEPLVRQLLDVPLAGSVAVRGQLEGQASDFRFNGSLESREMAVSSLEVTDLRLTASLPILSSALEIEQLRYGGVRLSRLSAPLRATSSHLELPALKANFLGGLVRGQLRLALGRGASSLKLDFENLDLREIAAALPSVAVRLTGRLSGSAKSTWSDYDVKSSVTDLTCRLEANSLPTPENPTPRAVTAEFAGRLANRSLTLSQSSILTGSSRLSAKGTVSLQKFDLEVGFSTLDLEEAAAMASQLALFEPQILRLDAQGGASFSGRLTGTLSSPAFSGLIQLQDLRAEQESLGRFGASIEYALGRLAIKNGRLVQENGGEVKVDFDGPLTGDGLGSTSLEMKSYQIDTKLTEQIRRALFTARALPLVSFLEGYAGSITGKLALSGVPSPGRLAEGHLNLKQIVGGLTGQGSVLVIGRSGRFQSFETEFTLSRGYIDLKDVAAALNNGRVSGHGSYDILSEAYKIDAAADLDLAGFAQELPTSTGTVSVRLKGTGTVSKPQFELAVACPKLRVGEVEINSLLLKSTALDGIAHTQLKVVYLNQPYEIAGKVRLSGDFPLEADAEIREKSLLPLLSLFTRIPPRLATVASGRVSLRGPLMPDKALSLHKIQLTALLDRLDVIVKVEEDDLGYIATNDGSILIEAMSSRINFRSLKLKGDGTSLSVTGSYSVNENSQLDLQGQASLKLLNTLSNSIFADGTASMGVQIYSSTTGKVRLKGIAEVRNVSLRYVNLPIALQQGSGRVVFNTDRMVLENFNARVGGGAVRLSGGLLLDKENIGFRLGINATDVKVNYPQSSRSTFSGNLVLQGTQKLQVLSGSINVSQFEYRENTDLATVLGAGTGATFVSDPTRESPLKLDISINAQDTLVVNNNLAELIGSASLKLTGPVNNPIVSGEASVTRGTLFLRNERYQITRGLFFFPGKRSRQVQFDVESDTEIRGYRVILNLSGSLERLDVTLRSEPALSQVDIVNLLTTGQPPTSTGQIQAAGSLASGQVAANTAAGILFGTLSSQVEQRTDKLFGLNRFQIDPLLTGRGSNPTARITIGRRVTRDLSVTYSTDLSTGREQIFLLEYRIRRNISLIGIRNEDGSYGFEFRLRRQF